MSNITRPQMTRDEAEAFYELRKLGKGCAARGFKASEGLKAANLRLVETVLIKDAKLHHAVTEGAKTCKKLNDVIQSKEAAIEAGHDLLLDEIDKAYELQTKVKKLSVVNAVLWFGIIGSVIANIYRIFGG